MPDQPHIAAADSAGVLRSGRRALYVFVAVFVAGIVVSIVRNVVECRALAATAAE